MSRLACITALSTPPLPSVRLMPLQEDIPRITTKWRTWKFQVPPHACQQAVAKEASLNQPPEATDSSASTISCHKPTQPDAQGWQLNQAAFKRDIKETSPKLGLSNLTLMNHISWANANNDILCRFPWQTILISYSWSWVLLIFADIRRANHNERSPS